MLATLFSEPDPVAANARNAFIAAFACAVITGIWMAFAAIAHRKKKEKPKLPALFWCIAGSAVGLFVLGIIGMLVIDPTPL